MRKAFTVVEYRKKSIESDYYIIEHRYSSAKEMIESVDLLTSACENDMKNGKIVDWLLEY